MILGGNTVISLPSSTDATYYVSNTRVAGSLTANDLNTSLPASTCSTYHVGPCICRGVSEASYYTLEMLHFSPNPTSPCGEPPKQVLSKSEPQSTHTRSSNKAEETPSLESTCNQDVISSATGPVPLWKTLRRNSSGMRGKKLIAVDVEDDKITELATHENLNSAASCLHQSYSSASACSPIPCEKENSKQIYVFTAKDVYCKDIYANAESVDIKTLPFDRKDITHFIFVEKDYCNSQSSPENLKTMDKKTAENIQVKTKIALKSPNQKPSKKTSKKSQERETPKQKLPKCLPSPTKDTFLLKTSRQALKSADEKSVSPRMISDSVKSKAKTKKVKRAKKQSISTSISSKTAPNEHAHAHSTNSSDTVAIALNNEGMPKLKQVDNHAALADLAPTLRPFSDQAEKMLSLTEKKTCIRPGNMDENDTLNSPDSGKSCHSLGGNSDTKPSVSSFTSQLPVEKKSSLATNDTQEISPKMTEEMVDNIESDSSTSDEESDESCSRSNLIVTAQSSPRVQEEVATPSEQLETVSNFVTKISDISGSFITTTGSSSHVKRHARQSQSSALHKRSTGEVLVGSKKYRKPRTQTEDNACTSPHMKAVRSMSCPMNPMTTPEYVEATRNTVIGSSSSFLKVLKGQRNWYPNVVTWFQSLFSRDKDTIRMSSAGTSKDEPRLDHISPCCSKDEARHSGQDDSFSSVVLDKLRPTGRWASAKVSTLLKLDVSSDAPCDNMFVPVLTSDSCMICPEEDIGPCPYGEEDEQVCDEGPVTPRVSKRKYTSPKGKRRLEKEKRQKERSPRNRFLESERPASILEEHEDETSEPTSPPSKPCIWQKPPKPCVAEDEPKSQKKVESRCTWGLPDPPPSDKDEPRECKTTDPIPPKKKTEIKLEEGNQEKELTATSAEKNRVETFFMSDDHDRYSIASLDLEGIGDVDKHKLESPKRAEKEQSKLDMMTLTKLASPSLVSGALSAAGNTIWSQLEKIRDANVKYQFPQRRGLYEPPKAYPMWLYAEQIQQILNFFGKGQDTGAQKDATKLKTKSDINTRRPSFDEAAKAADEARQNKGKGSDRDSGSSWATPLAAQPKPEEPVYYPRTVDSFRELRFCYPPLPLPIDRAHIHQCCHCHFHPKVRRHAHQNQSSLTCSLCPTHGATFRRRSSSSPTAPSVYDHVCCSYKVRSRPLPLYTPRCHLYHKPRAVRCASKRDYVRKSVSSCQPSSRMTPWSACCTKVLKMIHCDAFSQSELRRKSCLLSEKGDRYYYKNLFKKRINMRNFMKEMRRSQITLKPSQDKSEDEDKDKISEDNSKECCPENLTVTDCKNIEYLRKEYISPCAEKSPYVNPPPCLDKGNTMKMPEVSPYLKTMDTLKAFCGPPCHFPEIPPKNDAEKMDRSKNKSDTFDDEAVEMRKKGVYLSTEGSTSAVQTSERGHGLSSSNPSYDQRWDVSDHLIKMFSPSLETLSKPANNNVYMASSTEAVENCITKQLDATDNDLYQCPCGLNFVSTCPLQSEMAFNRKRELLASKIKEDGNVKPQSQVLPFAGPYLYEDIHPPRSQIKSERCKPKNDFRHSSFLYEDVLRDKFIPSKNNNQENSVHIFKSAFKKSSNDYETSPLKANQIANDVMITLPKVSYKPPIYKHGEGSRCASSRRYDSNFSKCLRKNPNLKRATTRILKTSAPYGDSTDLLRKPLSNNLISDLNSSNVFVSRLPEAIAPAASSGLRTTNDFTLTCGNRHNTQLLTLQHSHISAQTSSLLYGSTNYGGLLNFNPKSALLQDFNKSNATSNISAAPSHNSLGSYYNTLDTRTCFSGNLSTPYNSRMPFPYNNAEKSLVTPNYRKTSIASRSGRMY
ncbi:hypothetical protein BgiMline_029953 [Biomphalaria glabrata]|uniref:Uncharacterized protein LOC106058309 n=1 Tax=Biomphalaria glabrata TaxID=6526 RepID=A0A9U8E4A2_BIOGL|nr:uncharacterized protein LOC106058309 [Biomphalaria glabrata]KAI8736415.1 hypothetical protein BgiMline_026667 [Biomphalaria glabrata]